MLELTLRFGNIPEWSWGGKVAAGVGRRKPLSRSTIRCPFCFGGEWHTVPCAIGEYGCLIKAPNSRSHHSPSAGLKKATESRRVNGSVCSLGLSGELTNKDRGVVHSRDGTTGNANPTRVSIEEGLLVLRDIPGVNTVSTVALGGADARRWIFDWLQEVGRD